MVKNQVQANILLHKRETSGRFINHILISFVSLTNSWHGKLYSEIYFAFIGAFLSFWKKCLDRHIHFYIWYLISNQLILIFAFDPLPKSFCYLLSPISFCMNLNIRGLTYALYLSGLCIETNFTDSQSKNATYAKFHSQHTEIKKTGITAIKKW